MVKQRKNTKGNQAAKIYKVSILKDHDFDLDDVIEWNTVFCIGKVFYQKYKRNIVFTFNDIDDAFRFKMRWEIA